MFMNNLFNRDIWVHDVMGRNTFGEVQHDEPRMVIDTYIERERVHYMSKSNNIEYRTLLTLYVNKDPGVTEESWIEIDGETMFYIVVGVEKVDLQYVRGMELTNYYKITALATRNKVVDLSDH